MAEADFLSFLVDETIKLQKTGVIKLSSFELKLSDYKLSFLRGEFIPQSQVLRFIASFGKIDIPVNWSVFSIDPSDKQGVILSKEIDDDHLFEILISNWNPEFSKILVTHADGFCYLVGLTPNDEAHLHDLQNPQEWLKKVA